RGVRAGHVERGSRLRRDDRRPLRTGAAPPGRDRPRRGLGAAERPAQQPDPAEPGQVEPAARICLGCPGAGELVLRGGAGIYYDLVDPAILAELVSHSGTVRVRRGFGELSSWPEL